MLKKTKKYESFTLTVAKLRTKIARKITNELHTKFRENQKQGKFPWEGMWLTQQQIAEAQKRLKKRDKILFVEIIFVFLLMIITFQILLDILLSFYPP